MFAYLINCCIYNLYLILFLCCYPKGPAAGSVHNWNHAGDNPLNVCLLWLCGVDIQYIVCFALIVWRARLMKETYSWRCSRGDCRAENTPFP